MFNLEQAKQRDLSMKTIFLSITKPCISRLEINQDLFETNSYEKNW